MVKENLQKKMKYRFDKYDVEIVNPDVFVNRVHDDWTLNYCEVDIMLKTKDASFPVSLGGFTYSDYHTKADIIDWVNIELRNYIVSDDTNVRYTVVSGKPVDQRPLSKIILWFKKLLKK
jgi:hypothetical protein